MSREDKMILFCLIAFIFCLFMSVSFVGAYKLDKIKQEIIETQQKIIIELQEVIIKERIGQ